MIYLLVKQVCRNWYCNKYSNFLWCILCNIQVFLQVQCTCLYKNLERMILKVPLLARLKVNVSYLEYKDKWKYTICHLFIYVWCFWAITKMYVIGLYDHSLFFGWKILLRNTCTYSVEKLIGCAKHGIWSAVQCRLETT